MITYKNIGYSAKTFYGVKFNPGEMQSVPGYINSRGMVRVFGIKPASKPSINVTPTVQSTTRGRKKKSTEPEKEEVAEQEIKIIENISEEETSDGN